MENSRKIVTGGIGRPEWFVIKGESWVGPLTVEEVLEKIQAAEISWAHFAYKKGEQGTRRLCDIPDFQAGVPQEPNKEVLSKLTQTAAKAPQTAPPPAPEEENSETRNWFLHYNKSQFGPFSSMEIARFLQVGKIHGRVHAWRDGMKGWERLETVPEFRGVVAEAAKSAAKGQAGGAATKGKSASATAGAQAGKGSAQAEARADQRSAPRRPLVARLLMTDNDSVIVAVCRDISVGGMQVLTDRIPGEPGTQLKMNVSPPAEKNESIEPFVAEGVIVRILEDDRGFSFRFKDLTDKAKRAIESYISSEESNAD